MKVVPQVRRSTPRQLLKQLGRCVLCQQVPGGFDPGEPTVGNSLLYPFAIWRRKDLVLTPPEQSHRDVDGLQEMLVLSSVGWAQLSILAVERCSSCDLATGLTTYAAAESTRAITWPHRHLMNCAGAMDGSPSGNKCVELQLLFVARFTDGM